MATNVGSTAEAKSRVDGRHAWRERNRNAVVDALLDLYSEGNIAPGAQEVAERSGVSRRSLFRYFDDMDEMCRVAIDRHQERVSHLFDLDGPGEGTLVERIDRIVEQRARLFETVAPVRRIARLRAPFQPILASELKRTRDLLHRQVQGHFAGELATMDADERRNALAAADVLTSFDSFDIMRSAQGLSLAQTRDAMRAGLVALFRRC